MEGCTVIKGVVFDLDDTLYLERNFVRSGYSAVAQVVAGRIQVPAELLFSFMWDLFCTGNRDVFDKLLLAYPEAKKRFTVSELVKVYRTHRPRLRLPLEVRRLLLWLRRCGIRTAILSDGYLEAQRAKIAALGLNGAVDLVVLTDAWGRDFWKPHRRGYEEVAARVGLDGRALCYVGDNPEKDFRTPKSLGWYTIRIRCPGQLCYCLEPPTLEDSPHVTVNSIEGVREELELKMRARQAGGTDSRDIDRVRGLTK